MNKSRGTMAQMNSLIRRATECETRIASVYGYLLQNQDKARQQIDVLLAKQRAEQAFNEEYAQLQNIAKIVGTDLLSHLMKYVSVVPPFRARILDRDVQCIGDMPIYLQQWIEGGNADRRRTFQNAFNRALGKLRVFVIERRAGMYQKQYPNRNEVI